MISATISASTASGETLQTLCDLIRLRGEVMRGDTKDACVATVINALVSLRAGTRVARRPADCTISLRSGLVPSFRKDKEGGGYRRCLRSGTGRNAHTVTPDLRVVWRDGRVDLSRARVFEVRSQHELMRPFLFVGESPAQAKEYAKNIAMKSIAAKSGLAKAALGIAMAKLSTRNADKTDKKTVRVLASRLTEARLTTGANDFSLFVHDQLGYAVPALKKGFTVDTALKKAANRTAGIINAHYKRHGQLGKTLPTPFPEVKGHRR